MSTSRVPGRRFRRTRAIVSVGALGLLTSPLLAASEPVDVAVDGDVLTAHTSAETVADVLADLDVGVGPVDEVAPALEARVDELGPDEAITVDRAVSVEVHVDGQVVRRINAPVTSVAAVLDAADMDVRGLGGASAPAHTAVVEDGDVVHVAFPSTVTLEVDGDAREVTTLTTTVGAMLVDAGIQLGDDDTVDWDLGATLQPHSTIVVTRVTEDEVVEEVTLEHDEVRRETDQLDAGETAVDVAGADGLRHDTYRVELVDGEEVDRELVGREVVDEPVDRVVLVGTRPEPEPEPEPAPEPEPDPEPAPDPDPDPDPGPSSSSSSTSGDVWDRLARCESGGNWGHRGGTYHGGLQFHPQTWTANKPSGAPRYAYEASREQQIAAAENVRRSQGWGAWPHCSQQLGLR
jgi:resuscitation-promoting factor RpfB